MVEIKKTIELDIMPLTKTKSEDLSELERMYKKACRLIVSEGRRSESRYDLHNRVYKKIRDEFGLHSQVRM